MFDDFDMMASLNADGFVHLKSVLDPVQVAKWRDIVLEASTRVPNRAGGAETVAMFAPGEVDRALEDVMRDPQLGRLAATALGVERVRLFAGTAYLKPMGAPGSFWHQDMWFFPLHDVAMITLWVPLSPIAEGCAPMVYAKGSHKGGFMDWVEDQVPDAWPLHSLAPMAAGDVVIHDGWTLHGSEGNCTDHPREALGLALFPDGAEFARLEDLQKTPARWKRMEHLADNPEYEGGRLIGGARCPLMSV